MAAIPASASPSPALLKMVSGRRSTRRRSAFRIAFRLSSVPPLFLAPPPLRSMMRRRRPGASYRFGAGQSDDLVFLTISTGIGGGIIVNGKVVTGACRPFRADPQPVADAPPPRGRDLGPLDGGASQGRGT